MRPAYLKLTADSGTTFYKEFVYKPGGVPMDLSDFAGGRFQVAALRNGVYEHVFTADINNTRMDMSPLEGKLMLELTPADTTFLYEQQTDGNTTELRYELEIWRNSDESPEDAEAYRWLVGPFHVCGELVPTGEPG